MSKRAPTSFIEQHPTRGAFNAAKEALNRQHHPEFGAPHFPPSENLPPQAKRLSRRIVRTAPKRASAGPTPTARTLPPESRTPIERGVRDRVVGEVLRVEGQAMETLHTVEDEARPVIEDARGHLHALAEAWVRVLRELRAVVRIPGAFIHALREPSDHPAP
jgi:hypothetical protein